MACHCDASLSESDDSPLYVHRPLGCERHRARMAVTPLPPLPENDEEMLRALFSYLAEPSPHVCQRDLVIGAHVVRAACLFVC